MATGEWSSKDKTAKKSNFEPFAPGEYELKLLAESTEVRRKQEPGKMPYIGVRFEALGTATSEGGKNRLIFHNFFTSLKPGKNGDVMPERADQILGYAKALGDVLAVNTTELKDENGGGVDVLTPLEVKAWLMAHDGQVVKAKVKVDRSSKDYPAKNAIDFFVEAEGAADGIDGGMDADPETNDAPPDEAPVPEEEEAPKKAASGGRKGRGR